MRLDHLLSKERAKAKAKAASRSIGESAKARLPRKSRKPASVNTQRVGHAKDAQRVKRETAVRKSCGEEPVSFSGFIGKETAKQKPNEN